MATPHPPGRLAAAIAALAAHTCDSTALKAVAVRVAAEHFSLVDAHLVEAAEPPLPPARAFALGPGLWLAMAALPADPGDELRVYAAVAAALLKQSRHCELASTEYAAVLTKLDQLKRDLDTAQRSEWVATERLRIAQDLHDRVAQTLFGLGLTADWLLAHVEPDDGLQSDLERLKQLAATGLTQVREAIFSLSSAPVEPANFRGAVRGLLKELDTAGMACDLKIWGDVTALPPTVTDGLYQIIHEALVNVRRHSGASSVLVSVRVEPQTVTAVVQDDGQGLPPGVVDTYRKNGVHMGLRGMESRTERLGGRLTLAPGDECGLIVTVTIPLKGVGSHA
jgi:signal transduction histidine kinase